MAIRILLLTQWFDPEPTFKGLVFARELIKQGFEVEVLTGFPNYPSGKLYPGYQLKFVQREVIDGVQITRVPLYPNHDQSAFKRILNYASFAATSLIYGLFMAKRADVIYAYHPPLTIGLTASLIRLFRRIPVVYDVQDMWPDTLRATGMMSHPFALGIVANICQLVYRCVDKIVVLSPGFKKLMIERGVPESKIDIIYNWADEYALATPQGRISSMFPTNEKFRVLFAGNMGKAQALDAVLDAAALLQKYNSNVCIIFLGGGVEVDKLKHQAETLHLSNVVFIPAVPMAEVGLLLAAADALLVHLRKDSLFEITIPSKTQAYMSVGKPLIMAVDGDAADLVRKSGGGIVAESENPQAIANAIEKLTILSNDQLLLMGQLSQVYYREHLALAIGVSKFGDLFRHISNKKEESNEKII